jgi:WD40 repeat protein
MSRSIAPRRALAAGAFCVAIAGLAFLAVRVTAGDGGQQPASTGTTPSEAPSDTTGSTIWPPVTTAPWFSTSATSGVDHVLDLDTGAMTPLPDPIIRSLGETGDFGRYAASSDGSALAYVGIGNEGSPQVFIAGIDGTGVRQVTHDPTGAMSPAWSPDGTRIAYVGYGDGQVENLFIVDVASGVSTRITTDATYGLFWPQFTPDGSSLLYTDASFYPGRDRYGCCGSQPVVRIAPIDGGGNIVLFGGGKSGMDDAASGSLSPDGSLVTMMGSEIGGPGAIRFVANIDGTELRSLRGRDSTPAGTWSPDGTRIVCSGNDGAGSGPILVVDVETGEAMKVAKGRTAIWLDDHRLLVEV